MANVLQVNKHKNRENGLYATLHLQANKINELLLENERLAASNQSLLQRVAQLEDHSARLQEWHDLASVSLQTHDINVARQQLSVLWGYVHAMGSPEHRAITFISRIVDKLLIGRVCKRGAKWLYAIAKA